MRTRLFVWLAIVVPILAASSTACADPIPPGAPLDGRDHNITLFEVGSESLTGATVDGVEQTVTNHSFTLLFEVQPGSLNVPEGLTGGAVSDTIKFTASGALVTVTLSSDGPLLDFDEGKPEDETVTAVNPDTNATATYTVRTLPTPEPSTMVTAVIGAIALAGYAWRWCPKARNAQTR